MIFRYILDKICCTNGIKNAKVLPEPVGAHAIKSRLFNVIGSIHIELVLVQQIHYQLNWIILFINMESSNHILK